MNTSKRNGFTLIELCVVLLIISIMAAIVYPVLFPRPPEDSRRYQCLNNLKRIGAAARLYAQDYDETFPPAARYKFSKSVPNPMLPVAGLFWLGNVVYTQPSEKNGIKAQAYLLPYVKTTAVFYQCPVRVDRAKWPDLKYAYMTNDLAGSAKLRDFSNAPVTVLMMEGESVFSTAGHAFDPAAIPAPFAANYRAGANGAAKRHRGGASYLFADGHAQWFIPNDVFFPPRDSDARSHYDEANNKIVGPNPGGTMDLRNTPYKATFHLR